MCRDLGRVEGRKGGMYGRGTSFRLSARSPVRLSAFAVVLWAASACSDGRIPLVVYSPHGRELLTLAEQRFEAAYPDVDVRWLDMGSQDVLDRLRSERANPQADVWFGGPSPLFQQAIDDSLLEPYRPAWADAIPERDRGPGDYFFTAYETLAVIAFNSDAISRDEAPTDWDDVLDPRWEGDIIIRDPIASGTMRAIFGMVIQRSLRATGDTAEGFAWLRRLDAMTREYVLNPALLHQKLIRQEGILTLWDLPDILVEQGKGQPFDFTLARSGTPVIQDAIALVRGSHAPDVARRFIDWVGSREAQILAARETYRLPARTDLPADSLPPWVRRVREELVVEPMDWGLLGREGAAWMTYWDRHVRGQGGGR